MAQKVAIKRQCDIQTILNEWHYKRDYSCIKGNEIHLFAQSLWKNEKYETDYTKIEEQFVEQLKIDLPILQNQAIDFYNDYKDTLEFVKDEQFIYDEDYDIAGSIDLLFKNKLTNNYIICDFKSNSEIKYKGYGKMKVPLNNLDDCNFNHYSLQVYIYKHIFEKNTGLYMDKPFIIHFDTKEDYINYDSTMKCMHDISYSYKFIDTKDLEKESIKILEMRRNYKMGKCIPILIIGKSGSGKSTSLRNFKREEISIVNPLAKRLPFKCDYNTEDCWLITKDYQKIKDFIVKTPKKIIIIDDIGYIMTDKFVARAKETGYGKFTDLAKEFYDFIEFIKNIDGDKRIYLTMHEEKNDVGDVAPKTIGKMLDSQICIEGMFTIVLRAMFNGKDYVFKVKTDGNDVTKAPMDMFNVEEIDNNLKLVDDTICEYYNIKKEEVK